MWKWNYSVKYSRKTMQFIPCISAYTSDTHTFYYLIYNSLNVLQLHVGETLCQIMKMWISLYFITCAKYTSSTWLCYRNVDRLNYNQTVKRCSHKILFHRNFQNLQCTYTDSKYQGISITLYTMVLNSRWTIYDK